jgi:hypothetical protein
MSNATHVVFEVIQTTMCAVCANDTVAEYLFRGAYRVLATALTECARLKRIAPQNQYVVCVFHEGEADCPLDDLIRFEAQVLTHDVCCVAVNDE